MFPRKRKAHQPCLQMHPAFNCHIQQTTTTTVSTQQPTRQQAHRCRAATCLSRFCRRRRGRATRGRARTWRGIRTWAGGWCPRPWEKWCCPTILRGSASACSTPPSAMSSLSFSESESPALPLPTLSGFRCDIEFALGYLQSFGRLVAGRSLRSRGDVLMMCKTRHTHCLIGWDCGKCCVACWMKLGLKS